LITESALASKISDGTRVLILGAGFAGMSAANSLCDNVRRGGENGATNVEIVMVDQKNYQLYTPFLFQSATGLVDPDHIAQPVRPKARKKGFDFVEAKVKSIDLPSKSVFTTAGKIAYDYLIIALGSVKDDAKMHGAEKNSIPLKTLEDSEQIHNRIIYSFEKASLLEHDNPERSVLLTFVVIGGTTGVELAGSIYDYINLIAKDYPQIDVHSEAKVMVIEAHDRLFPEGDKSLSDDVKQTMEKRGIEIRVNTKVMSIEPSMVKIQDGSSIQSANIFWNAGIKANPVADTIPDSVASKHRGRIVVDDHLRVPNFQEVYVIGDVSAALASPEPRVSSREVAKSPDAAKHQVDHKSSGEKKSVSAHRGRYAPPTAEAAVEEGSYVGRDLALRLYNNSENEVDATKSAKPFRFKEKGVMLSIGRHNGLVKFTHSTFKGYLGWLIWRLVHVALVSTMQDKISVIFDWTFGSFRKRNISQFAVPGEAIENIVGSNSSGRETLVEQEN